MIFIHFTVGSCVYSLFDHTVSTVTAKPVDYVSRDWSAFDAHPFEEELANTDLADMHTDDVESIFF